jgi:phosphatidylserine/phosphatidylglycerophosphate/cardiolipin synthase-like enzyme
MKAAGNRVTVVATGERLVGRGIRSFDAVIRELLAGARREVQLAAYRFDASALPLLEALEQTAARGISVTVLVDSIDGQPGPVRKVMRTWCERGRPQVIDFRLISGEGGRLHAKVVVTDRTRALVGSANFTWGGLVTNHEVGVLLDGDAAWMIARMLDALQDV